MTAIILLTALFFVLIVLYETTKVAGNTKNILFISGIVCLAASWALTGTLYGNYENTFRVIAGAVLMFLSGAAYIYILFPALPKGTYTKSGNDKTLTSGIYGICRHPGFFGFTAMALSAALLMGSLKGLAVMTVHSLLNFIYIFIQDKYFFPKYLKGYDEYKKKVPFIALRK